MGRWTISSLAQGLENLACPIALMILALRLRHGLHRRDPRCRWAVAERSRVRTQSAGNRFFLLQSTNHSKGSLWHRYKSAVETGSGGSSSMASVLAGSVLAAVSTGTAAAGGEAAYMGGYPRQAAGMEPQKETFEVIGCHVISFELTRNAWRARDMWLRVERYVCKV